MLDYFLAKFYATGVFIFLWPHQRSDAVSTWPFFEYQNSYGLT